MFSWLRNLTKKAVQATKTEREWLLWMHEDSGQSQIGRPVCIDGRKGKVVDGTMFSILVEWEE